MREGEGEKMKMARQRTCERKRREAREEVEREKRREINGKVRESACRPGRRAMKVREKRWREKLRAKMERNSESGNNR